MACAFLTFLHLVRGVPQAVLHLGRESLRPFDGHFLHYGDIPIFAKSGIKRVVLAIMTALPMAPSLQMWG
jgi:hypothetical protein